MDWYSALTRVPHRWTFSAPSALLPGTLHTISPDGSLHVAETVEVEMTETTGTHSSCCGHRLTFAADGAVAAYRSQDPAIKIREYDGELYVVATHGGKMFQSIKSLYNSIDDSEQVSSPVQCAQVSSPVQCAQCSVPSAVCPVQCASVSVRCADTVGRSPIKRGN